MMLGLHDLTTQFLITEKSVKTKIHQNKFVNENLCTAANPKCDFE